ncbi:hypothetical protein ACOI1H_19150 [Loktanella sp. DJP18]|uniref:hypothetical protein n=1 Tax=Loktanella sp. DJP18 TaxID=3409788 RepID=UPI003BB7D847
MPHADQETTMTVLSPQRLTHSLASAGYPHALDDDGMARLEAALAKSVPAVLGYMERRIMNGGFPIDYDEGVATVFKTDPLLA